MNKNRDFKATTYDRLTKLMIKRLETIQIAVTELNELDTPLSQVQLRKLGSYAVEVKKKCADFELNLQRALESTTAEELDDAELSKQQDTINNLQAEICSMIEVLTPTPDPQSPSVFSDVSQSAHVTQSQVRLPQLDLHHFSGDLSNWTAFINLFDTTIHRNASLNAVIKFQYLLSVLQNEPLNLIKGLALTSANYTVAYNLLRERYHNPRRLLSLHLNQLLDLPNITISSTKGLRHFVNTFTEHSQALKALECDIISASNPLLAALILRKMDNDLRKRLESHRSTHLEDPAHSLPEVKDIISFLNAECVQVEDANIHNAHGTYRPNSTQNTRSAAPAHKKVSFARRDVSMVTTQATPSRSPDNSVPCFACNKLGHKVYSCSQFKEKTPQDRFNTVKKLGRCISCLGNHDLKGCQSQATCQKCQKKHHTLLHFNSDSNHAASRERWSQESKAPKPTQSSPILDTASQPCNISSTSVAMTSHDSQSLCSNETTVLLGTALVKLTTSEGTKHVFRALLDSGSMCDLISERAAQLLNTRRHKSEVRLCGLSQNMTTNKGQVFLTIETLSGLVLAHHQPMVVLDKLTVDLPRTEIAPEVLRRTQRYILADPSFHLPGAIDVVIGGAFFAQLLTNSNFSLGQNMPHVVGTHFGYVVMGSAPCAPDSLPSSTNTAVSMLSTTDLDLHTSLQRFWQQEEPPCFQKKTPEEEMCDAHFNDTHSREADGRYVVRLPFKANKSDLGSSQINAERRFKSLERKFEGNPEFSKLYHNFMNEYLTQGHMTECHDPDLTKPHFYLPHHGVLKETSSTTKLRTVFDASSKTSTGLSLNDVLLTGRKLQTNITDILMHFRSHNYVVSCDIRQMYRQIKVHPDDQPFQLILWKEDIGQPMKTFKLDTVTYGMNSSPYLAIKTLHQLADDEGVAFPAAAHVLRTQTYVDDVITGADTEDEAVSLKNELTCLLSKGGFELRKWVSNSPRVLAQLPEDHLETPVFLQESNQPHFSILGLHWSPSTDCFTYNFNLSMEPSPTKRSVLSVIAKIYDPCGFLSPCVIMAKCFMQFLWTTGLTWDEPLPPEHAEKWRNFVCDSQNLSKISIPRTFNFSQSHEIELHGFADASESAISAVIYFRCQLSSQEVIVRPVIAKTRVAPLKRVTIPRLELCAALLLAQLVFHCRSIFKEKLVGDEKIFLWTDSSVVLTWLRTPPYRLKTYVANRVSQAQELVRPETWRHISTSDNPADCASRGVSACQLVDHPLWWTGPPWLQLPKQEWPPSKFSPVDLDSTEEVKQMPLTVLTTTKHEEWSLLTRYSSWETLKRVMAWILRFVDNCRSKERRSGQLSPAEMKSAQFKIFFIVQQTAFTEDLYLLRRSRECSTRLQRLKPFIRSDGLMCVGGRLNLTNLSQDARNPVLLPKSHKVVELLVDHFHSTHLHAGPQLTQALLAQHVWILNARSVIRSRIFKCLRCFKNKPKNKTPLMGELPLTRVTPARPFLSSGIDYAGPLNAKILNLKAIRFTKVYLCLFVCMVTKAVHIEVVHDLTTDAFIAALTRFVSRRGLCSDIYSDCGTNFVGASSALRQITNSLYSTKSKDDIHRFSSSRGIRFHFNPPATPHQGGLWESAVKSTKHHLRRTIGDTVLTLPELITLTTQVEAMLNSRPLTPLSSDPADLSALTPGHFLIGAPLAAVPEPDLLITPQNRLKQWQLVQAFNQRIWRRWHLEYLHTLHQRVKWTNSSSNLKVGDLVLVHTPSAPLSWPLARITAVRPGADGIVRVVDLKTATGSLTRPATKVFPLPTD